MRIFLILVVLAIVLVLASTCVFAVDRSEYVYVTLFGRHVATYDGATQAGLYGRWPWPVQSVQRVDRRLQVFDLNPMDQITSDPQGEIDRRLTIEAFVCWRIADGDGVDHVDQFIRTVGTPERAQEILRPQIGTALSAIMGDNTKMVMDDLISDRPGRVEQGMNRLRQRLLGAGEPSGLVAQVRRDYGIELVDVRLRRHSYPEDVRQAITARIISERNRKKAEYESLATVKVGEIQAESKLKVRKLLADANSQATRVKGKADAEADRTLNDAFSKDSAYYAVRRKQQGYRTVLRNTRSTVWLSLGLDIFDLLRNPPKPEGGPPAKAAAAPRMPADLSKGGGQ
jgi:membrane protease subunit HflC